jgi:transglutaminase-like putative cysteine protease
MMTIMAQQAAAKTPNQTRRISLAPAEGWSTIALIVIMVMIVVATMQSLQWTPGMEILTPTALFGMIMGFVLAKQHTLPQWLADLPLLLIGIAFAFIETARATDTSDLLQRTGAWLQQALNGQAGDDSVIFLLFLAVLTMLEGYISMWLVLHTRNPWLAVIANVVVLLINLNYASDDRFFLIVVFMLIALLLLVRYNLFQRMRHWQRKKLRFADDIVWDFMQAGVLFSILVIILSSVMPTGYMSDGLHNIWNTPNGVWSNIQNTFSRLFPAAGGNGGNKVAFGSTQTIQGNVNLPDSIVLIYTPKDNNTMNNNLAAVTYDLFDGHTWSSGKTTVRNIAPNTDITPESSDVDRVYTQLHFVNPPGGDYIFAPGETISSQLPMHVSSDGVGLTSGDPVGSFTSWETPSVIHANDNINMVSVVSTATIQQLQAVPMPNTPEGRKLYPPDLVKRYTQLPKDLTDGHPNDSIIRANEWVNEANANTMYDKVMAIVDQFKGSDFRYSSQNSNPPSNVDAVNFLLKTQQGYCTWYATGLAIMARELGIPARVVAGFGLGTYDATKGGYVVKGTDSHMWTQIYFPGYGWINFEPSPGGFLQVERPSSQTSTTIDTIPPQIPVNRGGTPPPDPAHQTTPTVTPGKNPTPQQISPAGTIVTWSLSSMIVIFLLGILAIYAWWRLLYRGMTPVARAFGRMATLGRFAGVPGQSSQTATEYGHILAGRVPEQYGEIVEITNLYVRERWDPTLTEIPAGFMNQWQTVRKQLFRRIVRQSPRTWWRRLRHQG